MQVLVRFPMAMGKVTHIAANDATGMMKIETDSGITAIYPTDWRRHTVAALAGDQGLARQLYPERFGAG